MGESGTGEGDAEGGGTVRRMRHLLLAALALAACSSDPPPQCGTGGTSCADAGSPLDRPHVVDLGPLDAGADVVDAGVLLIDDPPASTDRLVLDVQPAVVDAGGARLDGCGLDPDGACIVPGDVPPDQGMADSGPTDAPVDRPESDARVVCTGDDVRCTTNEECQAACLPYPGGFGWCCPGRHHCIPLISGPVCPPYTP